MYTLYFSPGSCSLVVHCLLEELGVPFKLQRVDLEAKTTEGADFRLLNPKGKVPAISTPDGLLTECLAIVEYLCDRHGGEVLLGKAGTWERARNMERMATLATEVHPLFNRFFHEDDFSDDLEVRKAVKAHGTGKLEAYFRAQAAAMKGAWWSGDTFSVADIYFMVIARWGRWLPAPANEMPVIRPFYERMIARPAVARAFATEGIKPFGTS